MHDTIEILVACRWKANKWGIDLHAKRLVYSTVLDWDLKPHLKKRMESIEAIFVVREHVVVIDHVVELLQLHVRPAPNFKLKHSLLAQRPHCPQLPSSLGFSAKYLLVMADEPIEGAACSPRALSPRRQHSSHPTRRWLSGVSRRLLFCEEGDCCRAQALDSWQRLPSTIAVCCRAVLHRQPWKS